MEELSWLSGNDHKSWVTIPRITDAAVRVMVKNHTVILALKGYLTQVLKVAKKWRSCKHEATVTEPGPEGTP